METFSDFLERIHAFEYPSFHLEHDVFQPPLTLADKVRPDGSYRRFTGDTILYWLDQQTQKHCPYGKTAYTPVQAHC